VLVEILLKIPYNEATGSVALSVAYSAEHRARFVESLTTSTQLCAACASFAMNGNVARVIAAFERISPKC
jgi:hypothetical protein